MDCGERRDDERGGGMIGYRAEDERKNIDVASKRNLEREAQQPKFLDLLVQKTEVLLFENLWP